MYKCSNERMENKIKTFEKFGDAGHGGITRYALSSEDIMAKIKEMTHGRYLWLRNNLATIVCNCLENFLFYIFAFYPSYGMKQIISMGLATCLLEIVIGLCDTPFLYAATAIKSKEEMD